MPSASTHLLSLALLLAAAAVSAQSGDWVEAFRAPTGDRLQTTTQLYGTPTSISDDGTLVAVGCEVASGSWETRIYRDSQSTGWALEKTIPNSGFSVSVSGDGSRIALGDIFVGGQSGRVEVVRWDQGASDWVREGEEIIPNAPQAMAGYSVSMSRDGTAMIVGSKQHPGGGRARGRVEIFELVDGAWRSTFAQDGDADMARLGHAVAMDRDGVHAVASGATENSGEVYTFKLTDGAWARNPMTSTGTPRSGYGNSLATSDVAITAVAAWKDTVDIPRGQNGVVHFNSEVEDNVRPSIRYSYPNGMFGASVSLSADASIVAIGTNGFLGGVYAYAWDEATQSWDVLKNIPISTVTALGRSVSLSASGSRLLYVERTSRQLVVVDYVEQR